MFTRWRLQGNLKGRVSQGWDEFDGAIRAKERNQRAMESYSHGQGMTNVAGEHGRKNDGKGLMSKREQFLAFVWVGALAQDFGRKSNDTPLIMHIASQIPPEQIPDNVMNAAKVFLAFCNGICKRPHHWMLARRRF